MFDFILPFDLFIARITDGLRASCGVILTPLLKIITVSGNMGAIFVFCGLLMLCFGKTRMLGVATLVALAFGYLFTNVILKNVIARERPFIDNSTEFYTFWQAAGSLIESGYSFPSGHTTAATAFAVLLFIRKNKRYSWLFLLIPVIMGYTRIYFVVHYASDVSGGFIVGSIAAILSHFIVNALHKKAKERNL